MTTKLRLNLDSWPKFLSKKKQKENTLSVDKQLLWK